MGGRLMTRARHSVESVTTLMKLIRDPYGLLDERRRAHGELFEFRLPGIPVSIACSDPEAVRKLIASSYDQASRFAGGVELFVDRLALILTDDEPHRQRRKLLSPGFNAEGVRAFGPVMLEVADSVLERLPLGQSIPMLPVMQDITIRVILRCVFGVSEGPRFEELRQLVLEYLRLSFAVEMQLLRSVQSPRFARQMVMKLSGRARSHPVDEPFTPSRLPLQRIADHLGRIYAIFDAEITRRSAEPASSGPSDVLSMMLDARFEDGERLSHDELLAQLMMLVIGGYETTAVTLCWATHCVMQDRDVIAKVRAELDAVMGGGFDPARVRDLGYLGAVIQESMRLYPVAVGMSRRLRQPLAVGDRELPIGTIVTACIYLVQRDPSLWPEPERFRPERMLERRPPAHLHFPFGAGVWRCLGAAFAEHEMRIVLARLLGRFDLRPDPEFDVRAELRGLVVGPSYGLRVLAEQHR